LGGNRAAALIWIMPFRIRERVRSRPSIPRRNPPSRVARPESAGRIVVNAPEGRDFLMHARTATLTALYRNEALIEPPHSDGVGKTNGRAALMKVRQGRQRAVLSARRRASARTRNLLA